MDDVSAMAEGIDGSIWILSYGGLHRLNPDGLSTYDEHDGIKRERVLNIQEDQAGRLFTISGNFFVSSFDGQKFQTARPNIPEDETFTWQSMGGFLDSRGSLWVLTNKKLYRFDAAADVSTLHGRAPDAVFTEGNGLIGGNVLKVWEDSKGDLWFSCYFGTERRGLTRFERSTGQFTDFTTKDGLPAVPVATGFAEDTDGSLLFAFVEGGFARFRDGKFSVVQSDTAPTGGLTAMFRDSKNRIWAATNREGLMLIENSTSDNPSFRKFTTAEGLASNNIRCITEGTGEDIYVGTVRGVNRISPDTGRVVYFGPADGLATDFVNSIHRDKSGNIWIGTYNGLSRLTPRGESAAVPPGIMISGVQVGGEAYSVSPVGQSEVHLPDLEAGQRNIQIEFLSAGSNFSTPARYHYRLGSEGDWSNPSAEPAVSFANLPAGAFRFEVRAINEYGIVSNAPAFVQFTVLRPVWQRWWFLLLAALAIGGIAYAVYRSRLAQAVKLERIRTRIASDLHDDIGSSLSQIAILSEIARQKAGELGISEPLRKIAETSREMVDSMSDIVWAINPDKDTLGDLVSRMRRFAEETLDATDIAYRFEFAGSLEGVALGTDRRRDAYLIFKEAVNNLVKHSSARNARFTVASGAGRVTFTIEDDGVGYSEPGDLEQTFPGFGGNGLINMRRRAENRGGTFSFRSRPGEGSRVEFTLPTRAGVTAR
jgi:signal transduction histidine kinase/sugar lactone lactonase YvrE